MNKKYDYDDLSHFNTNANRIFALNLVCLMNNKKLKNSDLADLVRCSINYISELRTGKKFPSANCLDKLSAALNVPVANFFKDNNTCIEWCSSCQSEVEIPIGRASQCPHCGAIIKPCSQCDMDKVQCDSCALDSKA
jgi:DNA-binding Xre family transcriptional regulator